MPWASDGFHRVRDWSTDAAAGLLIDATLMDSDTDDIVAGLSQLRKDAQSGTLTWGGTALGAANTPAITIAPAPIGLNPGFALAFEVVLANTGPAFLTINALAPIPIQLAGAALVGGEMQPGIVSMIYDGTALQLPQGTLGRISGVIAGTGLSGGGSSGTVMLGMQVPVTVANGGTGHSTADSALAALGGLPLIGGTLTGELILASLPPSGPQVAVSKGYVDAAVLPSAGTAFGWINVKAYGAVGNGVTDDTSAFTAAITAATTGTGGGPHVVVVPMGHYAIKSGPIIVPAGVTIIGGNRQAGVFLDAAGADCTIFRLQGTHPVLRGLAIAGSNVIGTAQDVVIMEGGGSCVEGEIWECTITGGRHAISNYAVDCVFIDNKCYNSYGSALIFCQGSSGGYWLRNKFDQNFPGGEPASGTVSAINAWAPATPYLASNIVSLGGYLIQATTGGTSGAVAPTLRPYGVAMPDGTGALVWQLLAPQTYYGVQFDSQFAGFMFWNDMTGPFLRGIYLSNDAALGASQSIEIGSNTVGACFESGVYLRYGGGIRIHGSNNITNTQYTGGFGIYAAATFTGPADIDGNLIFNCNNGIRFDGGANITIRGNTVGNATVGITMNISDFTITGNNLNGGVFGASTTGISVTSGARDHYAIVANTIDGCATPISDGGTGTNKLVQGNNGDLLVGSLQLKGATPQLASAPLGANDTLWTLDTGPTGANAYMQMRYRGATKTQIGQFGANTFGLYDNTNSAYILNYNEGSQIAQVGPKLYTIEAAFMLHSSVSLTGGGTGSAPTLTAGPRAGNPTKWLPYDDNGTTRYIPAW